MNQSNTKKTGRLRLGFFLMCLTLFSCSNRKDYIASLDIKPNIRLKYADSLYHQYEDSVKLRSDLKNYTSIDLVFQGSDGISSLSYSYENINGLLLYKDQPVSGSLLNPSNGETILKYSPSSEGRQSFKFIVTDKFNGSDTASLSVLCFKNLPPISYFNIQPIKIVDPFEYSLDASSSYDLDRHFGGNISSYIFNVQGQTFVSNTSIVKYIFPAAGIYDVSLQVIDNDGAYSQTYSQNIIIN